MKTQQYDNHVRFYVPHHFIFYPVGGLLVTICIICCTKYPDNAPIWIMLALLAFFILWLSFMTRQHYALTLQNRIVVLEVRLRYYQLTQQSFEPLERQLSFGQIAALRFAPDEELTGLVQRTIQERLSPDMIKRSIKNWQADNRRV